MLVLGNENAAALFSILNREGKGETRSAKTGTRICASARFLEHMWLVRSQVVLKLTFQYGSVFCGFVLFCFKLLFYNSVMD